MVDMENRCKFNWENFDDILNVTNINLVFRLIASDQRFHIEVKVNIIIQRRE